jgi:ABC-2 type transport system ATP-binding protein
VLSGECFSHGIGETRSRVAGFSLSSVTAIKVRGLTKRYGDLAAVGGIDLTVEAGEVFALLGPNGAGKTTTVEILEGHREAKADRGFRERIGIVLQSSGINGELTVREAIDLFGAMYPKRLSVSDVIDIVELGEKADARISTLSGGQTRRIDLALGIVGNPDLIFLDEPTTGFDPSARRRSWSLVDNLRSLGKTILLTTHYMDEAQNLADRVAVISAGVIVAEGTPDTLGGREDQRPVVSYRASAPGAPPPFDIAPDADGVTRVAVADLTRSLNALTAWALEGGVALEGLTIARPSLEDVYLQLTGDDAGG